MAASWDRPLTPQDAPQQLQPDAPERLDEAQPWSKAGLRQRLERLPPGHPSSLRGADTESDPPGEAAHDQAERSIWSEESRFRHAWADHLRRWPDGRETTKVDRSGDPDGSWRGDSKRYLNPDQHAQAKEAIAGVQEDEKQLTGGVVEAGRESPCGGWLAGLEFRLKGEERLKEKVAAALRIAPAKSPAEVIREIPDAVRYTFCFETEAYTAGYWDIKQRLEASGHQMIYSRNHWRDDPEYKGINTRWITEDGIRFEVQFHSPESFHAKQEITHGAYERLRNRLIGRDERQELEAFQREVCSWVSMPSEAAGIPDYEKRD